MRSKRWPGNHGWWRQMAPVPRSSAGIEIGIRHLESDARADPVFNVGSKLANLGIGKTGPRMRSHLPGCRDGQPAETKSRLRLFHQGRGLDRVDPVIFFSISNPTPKSPDVPGAGVDIASGSANVQHLYPVKLWIVC